MDIVNKLNRVADTLKKSNLSSQPVTVVINAVAVEWVSQLGKEITSLAKKYNLVEIGTAKTGMVSSVFDKQRFLVIKAYRFQEIPYKMQITARVDLKLGSGYFIQIIPNRITSTDQIGEWNGKLNFEDSPSVIARKIRPDLMLAIEKANRSRPA